MSNRTPRPSRALLFVAVALAVSACGRESGPAEQIQTSQKPPAAEAPAPPAPAPVVLEEQPPGEAGDGAADRYSELTGPPPLAEVGPTAADLERERRLAQREREIAAREERLAREERDRLEAEHRAEIAEREERERVREEESRADLQPELEPAADAELPAEPEPALEPERVAVQLPAGTAFDVEVVTGLSSRTSRPGDTFRARLTGDLRDADGLVAAPRGSEVVGEVTEVQATRRVGGRAVLGLRFTDLVLPSGETFPLDASFVQQGRSETGRDAATIGGGAAAGAVLGRILNKSDKGKGSILGAILGAAVGTAIASRTPGEEIDIPAGAVVALRLDRDLVVRAVRR
jgi:type IV secretory pathway VirB10-like protein